MLPKIKLKISAPNSGNSSSPPLSLDNPPVTPAASAVCGVNHVSKHINQHGICQDHLEKLAAIAEKTGYVFAIRPVNPFATSLIAAGYPTKDLNIKGKSSDWGPMAGLIPLSQKLSKVTGTRQQIKKLNKEVRTCQEKNFATKVQLELSKGRVEELIDMNAIKVEVKGNKPIGQAQLKISGVKDGKTYAFTGKLKRTKDGQVEEGAYLISYKTKWSILRQPLNVLAKVDPHTGTPRPLTADYDLLMFAVPIAQHGPLDTYRRTPTTQAQDTLPPSTRRSNISGGRFFPQLPHSKSSETPRALAAGKGATEARRRSISEPDGLQDRGVISARLNELIDMINTELGRKFGNGIIQHGPDTENPGTVTKDNLPCVFFGPKTSFKPDGVWMARSQAEAITSFSEIKEAYQFFGNPKWNGMVIPRTSYIASQQVMRLRLPEMLEKNRSTALGG